jgi:cytochrome c oxidase assembly protein subunit 15
MATRLGVIFLLGAAQGALGWWMVQSGLADRVTVSHYRLAAHLGLAFLLFGYVLWTAFEVLEVKRSAMPSLASYRPYAFALAALVFLQILLGAFVAGLDAGLTFPTWPTYGEWWVPPGLYDLAPWWANHFDNHAMTHFQHRNLGYLIVVFAIALFSALLRHVPDKPAYLAGAHVLGIAIAQAIFGIIAVVSMVALPIAAMHQFFALSLFGATLWLAYVLRAEATGIRT